jgi:hypothetical protein
MTTTRSHQIATLHPTYGRLGTQCRLTLAEAQRIARANNAVNARHGRVERYVVEAVRVDRRMDAMEVVA